MRIATIIKSAKAYMPDLNENRLIEAYKFAEKAHANQKRKDGSEYIYHPLSTCEVLTHLKVDEDTLVAALLHDVPEDTKFTLKDIETRFGKTVAFLVEGITKLSKVHYKDDMAERQIESLKKMFFHSAKDLRIILVKLADRLHNMRTLVHLHNVGKKLRISKETLEIYVPIANLLGIWEIKSEMEDLCFMHIYPADFKRIKKLVNESALKKTDILKETLQKIKSALRAKHLNAQLHARQKNLYSIFKKMLFTGKTFYDIYDLIALRIIVDNIDDCYRALGIVHQSFRPKHKRVKDYIAVPKVNGYQSLHTTVFGPGGTIIEFQIRTQKMHIEDEYGIAAHYFYDTVKDKRVRKKNLSDALKKHAQWARKVLDIQKGIKNNYDFMQILKFDIFQDRIFVFTPKGEVIDLPYGSTAIDFAYNIHSDIGNHSVLCELNGERLPITTRLKTGNTVKIITSPNVKGPQRDWLTIVKTDVARTRIREFFKKESGLTNYHAGLSLLKKELNLFGQEKLKKVPKEREKEIFEKFGVSNMKGLVTAIGNGTINIKNVLQEFYTNSELLGRPSEFKNKLGTAGKLSKDRLTNAITIISGNEDLKEKANTRSLKIYRIEINVLLKDRVGLLRDVAFTLAGLNVNIHKLRVVDMDANLQKKMVSTIEVYDLDHLERALRALSLIDGVSKVYKTA